MAALSAIWSRKFINFGILNTAAPPLKEAMAQKTISKVAMGPQVNLGDATFDLKPALINVVQANLFCGKPHEDTSAHLQHIMEVCVVPSPSRG